MAKKKNKYEGFRRLTLLLSWVGFVISFLFMANSDIQTNSAIEGLILIGLIALFFYGVYKGVTYTLKGFFD